jgi:hypothetical protein
MDGAVEKSAMRKIYMRLLPFAILSCMTIAGLRTCERPTAWLGM